jgi:glycosyltransferase involved in cell wall biosynthesis
MTVGFYSPMPPAPTGVADYSAALLQQLRQHGDVRLAPDTCDLPVYHIGNNPLHTAIHELAVAKPGVVVLHDALLHHFYLGSFGKTEYTREFVYNYGEFAQDEADTLWRNRALSAQDPRFFARPMLRRIAETAQAVVVHNPAAALTVREHSPETPVFELPHFYERPQSPSQSATAAAISRFRSQLGIPENGFVFAVFGYLRESKRLIPALKVFGRLRQLNPKLHLLVAGQFVSKDLAHSAAPFQKQPGVHFLPHLAPAEFDIALASVDCCINLRYPTAGETSGIAIRAMGSAKPVIATAGEEWGRFPGCALFQIPPGPAESEALFCAMAALAQRPDLACEMGRQAADHIQRYHSLASAASEYWKLLCRTFASQN